MKCLYVENYDDPNSVREVDAEFRKDGAAILNGDKNNIVFTAYLLPLEAKEDVLRVCEIRQRLKQEYDDSGRLIYQLRNKYTGKLK